MAMSLNSSENHYAVLGVPFDASQREIRRAYHDAARRLHPDTVGTSDATDSFLRVQAAFETLSDPQSRARYDRSLGEVEAEAGLKQTMTVSRLALSPSADPQLLYGMVKIDPAGAVEADSHRPTLNVCLVIDTSTSMQGQRMDMVKITARKILQQLRDSDVFSVVTFSDRADVAVEATRGRDRNVVEARISMIRTGGGTEMYHGLFEGYRQLMRYRRTTQINHLILITDGQTYGDEEACLKLANEIKTNGMTLSALGIGQEWNEKFLDRLAGRTGGSSAYIAYARDIKRFHEDHFEGLQQIYAENVRLEIGDPAPAASLTYAFRVQPEPTRLEVGPVVSAGNLRVGETMVLLLEFKIAGTDEEIGRIEVLNGQLRAEITGRSVPTTRVPIKIELPVSNEVSPGNPPAELVQAMSRLTLYRMQEQVRADLEAGQFDTATRRLRHMATHVLASGDNELGSTILSEAARLESGARRTRKLEKAIMYGTKALFSSDVSKTLRSEKY